MPSTPNPALVSAAATAAAMIEPEMLVGLGTGSTSRMVLHAIAERMRVDGLQCRGVPTSVETANLASSLHIPLVDLDDVDQVDLVLDGADEVDPLFRMIKGRGGALLREKMVAAAGRRRVIVIAAGKQVRQLGETCPVPVEVSTFGSRYLERRLQSLAAQSRIRLRADGNPVVTDGGHHIIDCLFEPIPHPEELDQRLREIPGVFETGLFLGLCDCLVIGELDRCLVLERPLA